MHKQVRYSKHCRDIKLSTRQRSFLVPYQTLFLFRPCTFSDLERYKTLNLNTPYNFSDLLAFHTLHLLDDFSLVTLNTLHVYNPCFYSEVAPFQAEHLYKLKPLINTPLTCIAYSPFTRAFHKLDIFRLCTCSDFVPV